MNSNNLIIEKASIFAVPVAERISYVFVEFLLSDGSRGCGEATYHRAQPQVVSTLCDFLPRIVKSPCNVVKKMVSHLIDSSTDLPLRTALNAVVTAMFEAQANSNNLPAHRLMGTSTNPHIDYYANLNRNFDRTPEGWAALAVEAIEAGYKGVKIAPFDGLDWSNTENHFNHIEQVVEILDSVRKRIGVHALLMIDCHWCFKIDLAKDFLLEIEPYDIEWVEALINEESKTASDLKYLRKIANEKGIKLSGGEFLPGLTAFLPMLKQDSYDVINPDLRFCGIEDMIELAGIAEEKGLLFSPHNPIGPLNDITSAHISSTTQAFYLLERQYGEIAVAESLVDDSNCPVVSGRRELSTEPGWGLTLTDKARERPVTKF